MMLLLTAGPLAAQPADSQGFTGNEFLQWSRDSQEAFVANSISMIGIVASQSREDIALCIDYWYPQDRAIRDQRRKFLIDQISRFPDYHPQAVILAQIQKECGSFRD